MSRLHTVRATVAEIARRFGVEDPPAIAVPAETIEGQTGLVVIEKDGRRLINEMTWGFPRLTREMRLRGQRPTRVGMVANLMSPMWEQLVQDARYRCLIPITHFANPDGPSGAKTRTWFSVKDQPIAAWAGFCRNTPEFGPVYAGMTMDANAAIPPTNDRMPVLIEPDEHEAWLHGDVRDVIRLGMREPMPTERIRVERTDECWRGGGLPAALEPQLALL